jgi:hypothetical protein
MGPLNPQERELVQMLREGAIAHRTKPGIVTIISGEDLPPDVRECIRPADTRRPPLRSTVQASQLRSKAARLRGQ